MELIFVPTCFGQCWPFSGCCISHYTVYYVGFMALAYPGIFLGGGVQQIQLRTEDREDGDLGAVAP